MRDRILGYGLLVGAALALTAADSQAQASTSQAIVPAAPDAPAATETRHTLAEVTGKRLPAEVEQGLRCRQETCGDRTEQDEDDEDGTYRTEGR
jgi:hypothetical protein